MKIVLSSIQKYTEAYRGGYVTVLGDEMLDYFDIMTYPNPNPYKH